jgi:uncharacterized protein (TIGR02996 family)
VPALSDRQMLEAAIAADFEDVAAHAAYADLLVEEGDPRGEYIQLRLALENRNQSPRLLREWEERANQLLHQYQPDWLGRLAPFLLGRPRSTVEPVAPNIDFRCRRGWLTEIDVQDVRDAFITVLAGAREARMLQELTLRNTLLPNNQGPLERLSSAAFLETLKCFTLGDSDGYRATADASRVLEIVGHMPQLTHLTLFAEQIPEGVLGLSLPNLRSLTLRFVIPITVPNQTLAAIPFQTLAANTSFSGLERLFLSNEPVVDANGHMLDSTVGDLGRFLTAPRFRRLSDLTLRIPDLGNDGCVEIARSGILKRLKRLDLRQCNLTDEGAMTLTRCPDLARLERLDVGQNQLTGVGIDALLEVGIPVQYDSQWGEFPELPPADDYGFV